MEVVFAKTSASLPMPGGFNVRVMKGSHWAATDPAVLEHPDVFTDDPRYGLSYTPGSPPRELAEPPVEQATRAPGEKRTTRRAG